MRAVICFSFFSFIFLNLFDDDRGKSNRRSELQAQARGRSDSLSLNSRPSFFSSLDMIFAIFIIFYHLVFAYTKRVSIVCVFFSRTIFLCSIFIFISRKRLPTGPNATIISPPLPSKWLTAPARNGNLLRPTRYRPPRPAPRGPHFKDFQG